MGLFHFLKQKTQSENSVVEINYHETALFVSNFRPELRSIHRMWDMCHATKEERISFLKFAVRVIANDLQASYQARMFYQECVNTNIIHQLFPIGRAVDCSQEISNMPLDRKTVVTIPYSFQKTQFAIKDITSVGFHPSATDNVEGIYVPEFGTVFLQNGRHHIFVSTTMEQPCFADVGVYNLVSAFPNMTVSEDCRFWVIAGKTYEVVDSRIALMYEMAREVEFLQREP